MKTKSEDNKVIREFKPTTLSLMNKSTVFLITIVIIVFGFFSYNTMPIELFPEAKFAYVFVKTIYPGNSPIDMENLVTRPLEREIHTLNGIKVMNSTSSQDNSDIFIEFNPNVNLDQALQDVKDAVDKAKSELPNDLALDPIVMDVDVNEFPIVNINLSGDYSINELKEYAEYLEEEIEDLSEITRVDIKGLNNREIQINVDQHKLEAFKLTFYDIENAVALENVSISGGDLKLDNTTRSVRTIGEFETVDEIKEIIVKHENGNIVYLRDVAKVVDGFEDPLTMARLNRQPVVSLQVVKKSGENLINATDKIFAILAKAKAENLVPKELVITVTNDQSDWVKKMVSNLENSIIMGIIFVVMVLFFFLGLRNGLFVGIAIPMSMLMSFVILNFMGSTINMMVLFGMVLALGMLVDNAIVVVENSHRFVHQGFPLFEAIKRAVGEIAMPIIASTATTLAAFFPLAFWPGMMGEFMKHLPITLIVVLGSSLFVALIIIPVLALAFVKKDEELKAPKQRKSMSLAAMFLGISLPLHFIGIHVLANILILAALLILLNQFFLFPAANWFQKVFLVRLENWYSKMIHASLKGRKPLMLLWGTFLLFILVMGFFGLRKPKIELFPSNEPSYVNILAQLPVGSDITGTSELMEQVEAEVFTLLKPHQNIVESVLTTIGNGVAEENEFITASTLNRGMVTVSFVDYDKRDGVLTSEILKQLTDALVGNFPGVQFSISKNAMGPPTGRPINLEIIGKDFDKLLSLAEGAQRYLESKNVPGVAGLKMDLDMDKPELLIRIDREKARRFGLSTAQIASTIRTALFGKEISDLKEGEEEYPIWMRLDKKYRYSVASLLNQKITFRSASSGRIMQVPISAVANFDQSTTYNAVNRKDMERVITIYSNVLEGFNSENINKQLKKHMAAYDIPEGFKYKFTGEQEDMKEAQDFMIRALSIALSLILIILVAQFNSFAKPVIIMASVFFSTIGVFGGIALFNMNFIVIMTGIGIISLAGVVVNNAIVLIDYIDYLKLRRKSELGLGDDEELPIEESLECTAQGGKVRLRPVLLTAITTILGLFPMASGMNIDFASLLKNFNPHLYFGGDNAAFWGPMAWAVIFGLTFATFLTLVLVPAIYVLGNRIKLKMIDRKKKKLTIKKGQV